MRKEPDALTQTVTFLLITGICALVVWWAWSTVIVPRLHAPQVTWWEFFLCELAGFCALRPLRGMPAGATAKTHVVVHRGDDWK